MTKREARRRMAELVRALGMGLITAAECDNEYQLILWKLAW